jgi:hypothetical protein
VCGRTSDWIVLAGLMEKTMSKSTMHNSEASLEVHELKDEELAMVTGGVTIKQKVVDD